MNRPCKVTLAAVWIAFLSLTAWDAQASEKKPQISVQWGAKMQDLYKTLAELVTDVSSDQRFNDSKNKGRIEKAAKKLASLSHDLGKKGMVSPDSDPSLQILSTMMSRESARAVSELKRGNRSYARSILRAIPGYCIACHTRNQSGLQFRELSIEPTFDGLSVVERGEFYSATRQFDRAIAEYQKVLQNPKSAQASSWDWERAAQRGLALAVRIKKDPALAQSIVDAVFNNPSASPFFKENAKAWASSIQEWKSESSRQPETEEGYRSEAVRLMAKARETQKYPMDRTGDVQYMRATAVIHAWLQKFPKGALSADAFFMNGLAYEVLRPLKTEELHEVYYEACVRLSPHTETSENCYRRLEESLFFGFTGSSGSDLPADIQQKLVELKALSLQRSAIPK